MSIIYVNVYMYMCVFSKFALGRKRKGTGYLYLSIYTHLHISTSLTRSLPPIRPPTPHPQHLLHPLIIHLFHLLL